MSNQDAQLARLDERLKAMHDDIADLKQSVLLVLSDHEARIRSMEARWWRIAIAMALVAGGTGGVASYLVKVVGG